MKKAFSLLAVFASIGLVIGIVGCVMPNPNPTPVVTSNPATGQLQTNSGPAYVVDAATISNFVAQIRSANSASAPVNPYAGLIDLGATIFGSLLTGGSIAYAKYKSNQVVSAQAATSQAQATTNQLAASVAAQGPTVAQAVLDHASNSTQANQVFAAVNAALPPDPVGTPKTS